MTLASLLAQLVTGLATASSLFIVASGLTLIFGVTRVVNFAHGSLYMLGAYLAWSLTAWLAGSAIGFWIGLLTAATIVALIGALIERTLLRRIYHAPELLQLAATFGVMLIVRDLTLATWGAEDRLGPRVPGLDGAIDIAGRAIPSVDLLMIGMGIGIFVMLWWLVRRTRFGMQIRAAAENRTLLGALGVDSGRLHTLVFALGAFLAGLAGALQLPREPANLGMDLSVIADAFVVTVVGGLGSIPGAFIAALLIGLTKVACISAGTVEIAGVAIAFPKLTLVVEFVVMAMVLAIRPQGLLGAKTETTATTMVAEHRELVRSPGPRGLAGAGALVALLALLPAVADEYAVILATDILIFALFAASLQFLMGTGGLASFGHAAYFGLGTYATALAIRHGMPMAAALALAPLIALVAGAVFGAISSRLSGVYLAMLSLAFAQIVWSIAVEWDDVTGGSNGIVGVWPVAALADKRAYFLFALAMCTAGLAGLAWIARTPFGFALRAARDSPLRAEASGLDLRALRFGAYALAGAFAGLAGGLLAFAKGSISPETLSIARSVDALIMVLLGGLNASAGPVLGATAFTFIADTLARATEYWRAVLGALFVLLVIAFPMGIGGALARIRIPAKRR